MSQKVSAGSEASVVVSGRDTNIGFSKEDMKAVIESVAAQLPQYAVIAKAIVDERLEMFEKKILERFEAGQGTNTGAFADPDFQYLLGRAQHAYARSGDDATADVLIDLIAERSVQKSRTRLSLSLNAAVEKAPYLTVNEFAEISLSFALRYSSANIDSFPKLAGFLRSVSDPFLRDVSTEQASYLYLQAQGCGHLDSVMRVDMHQILVQNYVGVLTNGAPRSKFEALLGPEFETRYPNLTKICIHNQHNLQVNSLGHASMVELCERHGLSKVFNELWSFSENNAMTEEQIIAEMTPVFWGIKDLFAIWRNTPMGSLSLTPVAMAIGFANLARLTDFKGELSTWIT